MHLSIPGIRCDSMSVYRIIKRYKMVHTELFLHQYSENKVSPLEFLFSLWFLNYVLASSVTEVDVSRQGLAFVECKSVVGHA